MEKRRNREEFENFKKTGKITDYLNYIKNKKSDMEISLEREDGIKRRNNNKDN